MIVQSNILVSAKRNINFFFLVIQNASICSKIALRQNNFRSDMKSSKLLKLIKNKRGFSYLGYVQNIMKLNGIFLIEKKS